MTEINNLENNIKKQLDYYRQLIKLEKEKQQALVENVIKDIENITAQEEKILLEVGRLEEERLYWAEFFGKEIGKQAEEITLADLEERFPVFQTIGKELETEIAELKNLHDINKKLLENALNIVDFNLKLLTSEKETTYSNLSNKVVRNKNNKNNLIDQSI